MKKIQYIQPTYTMRYSLLIVAAAIVLSSCGSAEGETNTSAMDSTSTVAGNVTPVTTINLTPTDFSHYFTVQGVVEATQNAQLFPEVAGRITSIPVSEGDKVSKGQTLMTLDNRVVSNQISEIKSRLNLAKTVFEKQKTLWDQEIGSEIQYLEAKNNYESLQRNLETVQAQQSMYVVSAPFSGIVDEIIPKVGEMANPAMPAFRLINMDDVYVKADVTERYLDKIKAGDSVRVFFPSLNHETMTTIKRLGNFINPNNRTFKIKMELPNEERKLRPNLLAEISVRDYHVKGAVTIPTDLVQLTPTGQEFVYTIEEGIAKKKEITTGVSHDGMIEISSGLTGSEVLINKGARSIKDGDQVEIRS
ncbi:MAG: efflux RND transporter periplasmic adaptor subunit [Salibacteraceae bacterium]